MIEHALRSLLAEDTTIEGLVGERIYYTQAVQEADTPYIVITKVSGLRVHSHQGTSSLANPRIQLSVFSATYLEAKQIAQAIQSVLQGYTGTSEEIEIQSCLYINEVDMYEQESKLYHVAVDYEIYHKEG
jgi:DNA-binding NarL/FixJ family response regulator